MSKPSKPIIRERAQHSISRKSIDPDALSVLYRLSNAGYIAYLVGGGVRDLLLGRTPKDFDISTDAYPRDIKRLFRNAFLIGRRFRLALIRYGDKQIETSTFRRDPQSDEASDDLRPGALYQSEDNAYGTPAEDALRRDFTVNGLFYDIQTFAVIDYVGGLRDLEKKVLRCIGDPNIRFREDPVRMMRAVRFSSRLGFRIHRDSEKAIDRHHGEILQASRPRLFEEVLKLFGQGAATEAFRQLWTTKLMSVLLPVLHDYVQHSGRKRSPLWKHLEALDARSDDPVAGDASFRLATLLCPLYLERLHLAAKKGAFSAEEVADRLVEDAVAQAFEAKSWRPPKAICGNAAAMLSAQAHFDERDPLMHRARVFAREWFPGALLLYHLRMEATKGDPTDAQSWTEAFQQHRQRHPAPEHSRGPHHGPPAETPEATEGTEEGPAPTPNRRRRRRRRNRHNRSGEAASASAPTPSAETPAES